MQSVHRGTFRIDMKSAAKKPFEVTASLIILLATFLTAIAAAGVPLYLARQRALESRSAIAARLADVAAAALTRGVAAKEVAALAASSDGVAGVRIYTASGAALAEASNDTGAGGDAEMVCRSATLAGQPGTVCVSSAGGSDDREALTLFGCIVGAALCVGVLLAWTMSRGFRARMLAISTVVRSALEQQQFTGRVPAGAGAAGDVGGAVNSLLEHMNEREVMLRRRSSEVEQANKELEAFAYSVSHDLRAPLGSIRSFAQALGDGYAGDLSAEGREYVGWIVESADQMTRLIDGLLQLSRFARADLQVGRVDITAMATSIADALRRREPERRADFAIAPGLAAEGDERLLRAVLENLMSNAWKFTRKTPETRIMIGAREQEGARVFFVKDNGAGFDPSDAAKIFRPFERVHEQRDFEGTGIGLATVQKVLQRHGGKAWAEGERGNGATIYFTVPAG